MKNNQTFEIGDVVFATKNSIWGNKPMVVVKILDTSFIIVEYPSRGEGGFMIDEIEHYTIERKRKLDLLYRLKLNKSVEVLEKELFPE